MPMHHVFSWNPWQRCHFVLRENLTKSEKETKREINKFILKSINVLEM